MARLARAGGNVAGPRGDRGGLPFACTRRLAFGAVTLCAALVAAVFAFLGWLPSAAPRQHSRPSRAVEVQGARMVYIPSGDGEPVLLLLHGFGGNADDWERLAERVTGCGRTLALDLLGFGASSRPNVRYSLATHSRYLVGLMDRLKLGRVLLVGNSMGASLAAYTAAHFPGRVSGVVLMAPSGAPGTLAYEWPRRWFYRPGLLNRLGLALAETPLFAALFPHSLARQALGVTGAYDEAFAKSLAQIEAPALLLWSRGDTAVPFSSRNVYLDQIADLQFLEAPADAGHNIHVTAPAWSADAICRFVERIRSR